MIGWKARATFSTNEKQNQTNRASLARCFPRFTPLHVFDSNSDWFIVLFSSAVIGQSNYFRFGFKTIENRSRVVFVSRECAATVAFVIHRKA